MFIWKSSLAASLFAVASFANASSFFLDFNDNLVPANWTITKVGPGSNYGIANGQFYSGGVDSSALLGTRVELSDNVAAIDFNWDGNLVETYWGSQGQVQIFGESGETLGLARWRTTTYALGSSVEFVLGSSAGSSYTYGAAPQGTYQFHVRFTPEQVFFSGSLGGVTQFEREFAMPSLDMSLVKGYDLYTYQTIGPNVWMDNVSIQVSSVPEPAILSLFMVGLLLLAVARSRAEA